jgi:putative ABC transport system ATP-binding protein
MPASAPASPAVIAAIEVLQLSKRVADVRLPAG